MNLINLIKLINRKYQRNVNCRHRPGVVLLMTLVLLIILTMLGYTLTSRLAAQRHRDQYIIDYQVARYACDSGIKYALTTLADVNTFALISRPNEPDFSDLFCLSEQQYERLLAEWAQTNTPVTDQNKTPAEVNVVKNVTKPTTLEGLEGMEIPAGLEGIESNDVNSTFSDAAEEPNNSITIRGPYGPPWPFITEPVEFQIGSATVKIEIEDENAKYPLSWAMLGEKENRREALAGLTTFCEWMSMTQDQIDELKSQVDQLSEIKTFKMEYKEVKTVTPASPSSPRGRRRTAVRRAREEKTITPAMQTADFAKLFHSSLIDLETLARPTIVSDRRQESALKYMGVWASKTVNINTAPRQVLEAAFTFGGNADRIADEIIKRRRIKPFKDIDELKRALLRYSDSIKKCEEYITATSSFFIIRVTATSGVAKASAIIAVSSDGKKMEKIAVFSG